MSKTSRSKRPRVTALPAKELPALRRALLSWHRRHGLKAPWRSSGDPYQVLVAAVMAQQTQMSRVLPKFDEFMAAFPTVEALARARPADVLRRWALLGYNLRALRLHRAARRIVREGGFPRSAAELQEIEGVGPFTAAIVASFALGERVAAIDTNVQRVLARLVAGDVDGRASIRALERAAEELVAPRAAGRWNQAMMDLGGRVCVIRAPRCEACPIARWCRARPILERRRVAEPKAAYRPRRARPGAPFRGSRRYYRGRVVQALRELPPGRTLSRAQLYAGLPEDDRIGREGLDEVIEGLRRDGLVQVVRGRLRLP